MNYEERIKECLHIISEYGKWGEMLAGQSISQICSGNSPFSASVIHNGLKCIQAKMKLNVLYENNHTEKEKEKRLKQIDVDIQCLEEIMKHDLEYRRLLIL